MLNSVAKYLIDSATKYPQKIAVVDNGKNHEYNELLTDAEKIASQIIQQYGSKKSPIIVLMNNSYEAIATFWGVVMSGNMYVPIDDKTPEERFNTIVEIVAPLCAIVCQGDITEGKVPVLQYNEIVKTTANRELVCNVVSKTVDVDPIYILFTSGSTGIPKGVLVSHKAVIDFVEESSEVMEFSEKEVFLNQAPFYFDASVPDLFCSVRNASTLHIVPKYYYAFPIKLMEYINKYRVNSFFWVPSALITVANMEVLDEYDISCLKKIMFCGEVMPNKQLNAWRKAVPEAIYVNYYGPCEAVYACSYYIVDREFNDEDPLPIGKQAINTDLFIVNDGELISEPNKKGELYIRGTCLALGYFNNKDKTREAFVQNPTHDYYSDVVYKTGDLAHYDDEGNICFDGRADYQIKHMGYRIELGEIESVSLGNIGVEQSVCIYNESEDKIYCYYRGDISEGEFGGYISERLPKYMVPEVINRVDTFPYNANGKVDRKYMKKYIMGEKEIWMS